MVSLSIKANLGELVSGGVGILEMENSQIISVRPMFLMDMKMDWLSLMER